MFVLLLEPEPILSERVKAAELSSALVGKRGAGEGLSGCARPSLLVKQTCFRALQVFQAPDGVKAQQFDSERGCTVSPSQGFLELWFWGLKNESDCSCRLAEVMSSCLPGESLACLRFGLCLKSYWCLMGNWKNISFQKQYHALSSICSCPLSVFIKCWLWDSWRGQILWFLNRQSGIVPDWCLLDWAMGINVASLSWPDCPWLLLFTWIVGTCWESWLSEEWRSDCSEISSWRSLKRKWCGTLPVGSVFSTSLLPVESLKLLCALRRELQPWSHETL